MATLTRGQTFGATETITNTKLHNLVDLASISSLVNADIDAAAAIADTKLADITTGNKVSGKAIFNLASIPSGSGLLPLANIPMTSLASIANANILPLTLASWVDGVSLRNLASIPTTTGLLNYKTIVSSLASGGALIYDGSNNFVGGVNDNAQAGDVLQSSADVEDSTTATSYTKMKEIQLPRGGTYRIKFDLKSTSASSFGRIYRNGVAVGTEQSTASGTYTTYSEDISGWSAGDLCQLYIKVSGATATWRNFRIYEASGVDYIVNLDS